jgi:hypothetical protein
MMEASVKPHCRGLSPGQAPGIFQRRPGLKRIPPIDSIMQQKALQERHGVGSIMSATGQTPGRRHGSDIF